MCRLCDHMAHNTGAYGFVSSWGVVVVVVINKERTARLVLLWWAPSPDVMMTMRLKESVTVSDFFFFFSLICVFKRITSTSDQPGSQINSWIGVINQVTGSQDSNHLFDCERANVRRSAVWHPHLWVKKINTKSVEMWSLHVRAATWHRVKRRDSFLFLPTTTEPHPTETDHLLSSTLLHAPFTYPICVRTPMSNINSNEALTECFGGFFVFFLKHFAFCYGRLNIPVWRKSAMCGKLTPHITTVHNWAMWSCVWRRNGCRNQKKYFSSAFVFMWHKCPCGFFFFFSLSSGDVKEMCQWKCSPAVS